MILSTGMSEYEEVDRAVQILEDAGTKDLVLLHCVSVYPTPLTSCTIRIKEACMYQNDTCRFFLCLHLFLVYAVSVQAGTRSSDKPHGHFRTSMRRAAPL